MHLRNNIFKFATSTMILAGAIASGSASAGQGTVDFTANIRTSEFLLPAASCASGMGGIGAGTGTTNLFTKNPATDTTTIVLASFDCVRDNKDGTFTFGPGKFTLTGAGGDTIVASYEGTLVYQQPGQVAGTAVFTFVGSTFNIHGGTGRYGRATGGGTITGTETINPGTGTATGALTAVGKIVY